jgi:large subunit ribosomal protein L11
MAKKVKAVVRLRLQGGSATPAPPAGSALGPHGVNIMEFCKAFNAQTADKRGQTVPVLITVYQDRSFEFVVKTQSATDLIKQKTKISKGSPNPSATKVGTISSADVEEIAKIKMPDLNAVNLEAAIKIVAGSAHSMGVDVVD